MKWDKAGQEADDADDYVNVSKREPEESADYVNVAPFEGRRRGSDDYVNLEPATEPDEEEDQVSADYVNVAPFEGRRRGSDDYVNLEPATEPDEEEDQVSEGLKGGGENSQDAVDSDTESGEDAVVYTQIAFK
ncbi:UNVERIFIED_CONTAM: hypothetical protein FKN15_008781 [Acipenser sinensis]